MKPKVSTKAVQPPQQTDYILYFIFVKLTDQVKQIGLFLITQQRLRHDLNVNTKSPSMNKKVWSFEIQLQMPQNHNGIQVSNQCMRYLVSEFKDYYKGNGHSS